MIERLYRALGLNTIKLRVIFWTSMLIIGIGCFIFFLLHSYEIRNKEYIAMKNLEHTVHLQEDIIQRWFNERQSDIHALAETTEVLVDDHDKLTRIIRINRDIHQVYRSLFYADEQGNAWIDSESNFISVYDRDYFKLAMQGKEAISGVMEGRYSHDPVIVFSSPIFQNQREFKGLVAGSVTLKQLDALMNFQLPESTERVYLISRNGDILNSITDVEQLSEDARPNIKNTLIFSSALENKTVPYRAIDHRGTEVLWSAKWIADGRYLLLITIDRAEVLQSVQWISQLFVLMLLIIMLATTGIIVWLSNHFERPLMQVLAAARALGKGEMDTQIKSKELEPLPDEFRELHATFNGMAGTLSRSIRELTEAREQMDSICNSLNISLWSRNASNWRVIQMTPGSERIFGYAYSQLKEDSDLWLDMIHEKDQRIKEQMLAQLDMNEIVHNKYRILTNEGEMKWIQNHIKPTFDETGKLIRIDGVSQDISQRMLMEKELVLSEERFRTLFYSAGIGIAILNNECKFLETNSSLQKTLGFTADELQGQSCEAFFHEKDDCIKFINRNKEERMYQCERPLIHKDGSVIWARMTLSVLQSDSHEDQGHRILMLENVTQYKNTLAALEESENLYRSLVELSPDAVMVHSDGVLLYVNEKALQLLGAERQEDILYKKMLDFVDPLYHEETIQRVGFLYENRKPIMNIEQRYVRLDGSMIDVELSASVVSYKHKMAILVLARDITERKKNEERIRQINELLKKLSTTDGLTEIANRRAFDQALNKEWRRLARKGLPLSLILLDIDEFKPFNDTYGHQGGDRCLKEVADVINNMAQREGDLAARYGGEEFVLLLPDTDKNGAKTVAEKIRSKVEGLKIPHRSSEVCDVVTVSVGVATIIPSNSMQPRRLVDIADKALYQAKRNGRNQVNVFEA